jgi:hypothetical protein
MNDGADWLSRFPRFARLALTIRTTPEEFIGRKEKIDPAKPHQGGRSLIRMKNGDAAKNRIRLTPGGQRWLLEVDQIPVISTSDRRWLRRFAVRLRQTLAKESAKA